MSFFVTTGFEALAAESPISLLNAAKSVAFTQSEETVLSAVLAPARSVLMLSTSAVNVSIASLIAEKSTVQVLPVTSVQAPPERAASWSFQLFPSSPFATTWYFFAVPSMTSTRPEIQSALTFNLRAVAHVEDPVPTRTSASSPPASVAIATSPLPRTRLEFSQLARVSLRSNIRVFSMSFSAVVWYLCQFELECTLSCTSDHSLFTSTQILGSGLKTSILAVAGGNDCLIVLNSIQDVSNSQVVCGDDLQDFSLQCTQRNISINCDAVNGSLQLCTDILNIFSNFVRGGNIVTAYHKLSNFLSLKLCYVSSVFLSIVQSNSITLFLQASSTSQQCCQECLVLSRFLQCFFELSQLHQEDQRVC